MQPVKTKTQAKTKLAFFLRLMLTSAVFSFVWWQVQSWKVEEIFCQKDGQPIAVAACGQIGLLSQHSLLTLDWEDARWQSLHTFTDQTGLIWRSTQFRKRLPKTVFISYQTSPQRYLWSSGQPTVSIINSDGAAVEISASEATQSGRILPMVMAPQKEKPTEWHAWLLELLDQFGVESMPTHIAITDTFLITLSWPKETVLVAADQKPSEIAQRLKTVRQVLVEKQTEFQLLSPTIDLRPQLPVVSQGQVHSGSISTRSAQPASVSAQPVYKKP